MPGLFAFLSWLLFKFRRFRVQRFILPPTRISDALSEGVFKNNEAPEKLAETDS